MVKFYWAVLCPNGSLDDGLVMEDYAVMMFMRREDARRRAKDLNWFHRDDHDGDHRVQKYKKTK